MITMRAFRLEEFLGRLEFSVRHHLTASDAENLTLDELLAMATDEEREAFTHLRLSYIDSWGTEDLREAIAGTYDEVDARHVLAFAGAEEAIFWLMQVLVGPGEHAVVTVPNYQSMETVTLATGADVSPLLMRREKGWALDLDELAGLLRPETRLVAVNYPNNPTGHVPDQATFRELVAPLRRARHPAVLRRGVPRRRARPVADAAAGGRPLADGRLAQRHVEGLRASGAARRLARLPRPRAARAA